MEMSPEVLRDLCKKHELYRTPQLNDALYCNLQGFRKIANLEPYTGLVSLFLEGNALSSLDGLPSMPHLRCLYLQQNVLSDLFGLEMVPGLRVLNISHNQISSLSDLQHCTSLSTLICSQNKLTGYDSINALSHSKALTTVDLQDNNLDSKAVFGNLTKLPQLGCLYLRGNPVTSATKQYRRTLICTFPKLAYLDDRPIYDTERRCAEAWQKGGTDAERAERQSIGQETGQANKAAFESIQRTRREGFQRRRQILGLPVGDSDPFFELHSGVWEEEEEPPELQNARQQLADMVIDSKEEKAEIAATNDEVKECIYGSEELNTHLRTLHADLPETDVVEIIDPSQHTLKQAASLHICQSDPIPLSENAMPDLALPARDTDGTLCSSNSEKEAAEMQSGAHSTSQEPAVQCGNFQTMPHVALPAKDTIKAFQQGNAETVATSGTEEAVQDSSFEKVPVPKVQANKSQDGTSGDRMQSSGFETEPEGESQAEETQSLWGDLGKAQEIWGNMKDSLEEPAAARKPLEPLAYMSRNAAAEAKPASIQQIATQPALGMTAASEAKPDCTRQRASGYRSSFTFIKQRE